jgi:Electron transfer DM13
LLEAKPSGSCEGTPLDSSANGKINYRVEFPEGKSIYDIVNGSISVWCRAFDANFGEVIVKESLLVGLTDTLDGPALECSTPPPPPPPSTNNPTPFSTGSELSLGSLTQRYHLVSGEVVIISDRIIEINNFSYDGKSNSG